jgi:hypothetical protein
METFVSLYHEDVVVKVNGMHKGLVNAQNEFNIRTTPSNQ